MAQVSARERKTGSGMAWTLGRALLQLVVGVGVGVALARLLPPRDFGLIAIASGFGVLAEALALAGLGAALIQQSTVRRRTFETTLLLSLLFAGGIAALFALAAPAVARLYGAPELQPVFVLVGITQGVMILGITPRALLRRHLRHRTLAAIDLASYLLGYAGVSVTLAWLGVGAMSLAWGLLAWWGVATLACWWWGGSRNWRPRWSAPEGRAILAYGLTLSGKSVVVYLGGAVSNLLLGWLLGPEQLGLFQRAAQLALIPLQRLGATIGHVLFPAYALIQGQPEKLQRALLDGQRTLALICFPILTAFMAAPETVIVGLYGEQWAAAVPLLRILAVVTLVDLTHHLLGPLIEACGLAAQELRLQMAYVGLFSAAIALAAPFGLVAVAWAQLLPALILNLTLSWLAFPLAQLTWAPWLAANRAGLALGAATGLAALGAERIGHRLLPGHPILTLAVVAGCCALVYLIGLWRIPGHHQQWWRRTANG
jgi:PST family polysaccharide transporter